MLVLPYQTRLNARNLPLVTLTLVLLNALVYLVLQSGDQRHFESAGKLYAAASLATIEAPRYQEWLRQRDDRAGLARLAALQKQPGQLLLLIESDAEFARALRAGRVIVPGDPQYAGWREARRRVDSELDRSFTRSFGLVADGGWLRYLSYQFLHGSLGHLVGNMLVLLLAGPFAEAALGRARFLGAYLAAGVAGGFAHVMLSPSLLVGASAAIAGAMAMVAVLYGTRRVRVFYWLFVYFDTAKVPALALLPVWMLNELVQWAISGGKSQVAYSAHLGGIAAGALLAWLLQPRDRARIDRLVAAEFAEDDRTERRSNLLRQAQEAAARLDTRRAARLYGELADQHPDNPEYLIAYLNTALLSPDGELLSDAALRVLWFRGKRISEDLRKAFLQIAQPRLLSLLPVDEQLRLSRRLVRAREDSASLRVLDGILGDANLRTLYARQIADCLLALYTTYSRHGLRQQADAVQSRLKTYFPSPNEIGGIAPSSVPPATIRGAHLGGTPSTLRGTTTLGRSSKLRGTDTLHIDLSDTPTRINQ